MIRSSKEIRGGSGILAAIRECCASRQSALVVAVGMGTVHDATFEAISDEVLTLGLKDPEAQAHFQPMGLVFVMFQMSIGANAFMVHVRDIESEGELAQLNLLPPTNALSAKGRSVFRIPLIADHGLEVRVVLEEGRAVVARGVDISVAGVQVEFDRADDPGLSVGDVVGIELCHGARSVQLNGLVRRHADSGYGFSFPGCMTEGELSPRPELQEMVATIQRHWLDHRG